LLLTLGRFAVGHLRQRAPPPDYITALGDKAWLARGYSTRERAADSAKDAEAAASRARAAAEDVEPPVAVQPKTKADEVQAEQELEEALKVSKKAQALLVDVEERAYAAGRTAAEGQIRHLDAEAKEYFRSLEAEFKSLEVPTPDPKTEALLKAARPYYDAEMKLQAMVKHYNDQAVEAVYQAQRLATRARMMAAQAVTEQSMGQTNAAQRDMVKAHMTIGAAEERRGLAGNVQRLASNLNAAVPGYHQATEMAP